MAAEWKSYNDIYDDFNALSEFGDDEESIGIEINQNVWMDESSTETIINETIELETRGHSNRKAMDRTSEEVTIGLREAGIVFEDECSFTKFHAKANHNLSLPDYQSSSEESSYSTTLSSYSTAQSSFSLSDQESFNTAKSLTDQESYKTAKSFNDQESFKTAKSFKKHKRTKFRPLTEPSGFVPAKEDEWKPINHQANQLSSRDFPRL